MTEEKMREDFLHSMDLTPESVSDSEWKRILSDDYYAGKWEGWQACDAQSAEKIARLEAEVARLNKWADGFSDAQIKERQTGEMYQRELRQSVDEWKTTAKNNLRACTELRDRLEAAELSNKQFCKVLQQYLDNYGRYDFNKNLFASHARQVLAQQPSTEALDAYVAKLIPPGWRVVPIEPTKKMLVCMSGYTEDAMRGRYAQLIDAAPLPPLPEQKG